MEVWRTDVIEGRRPEVLSVHTLLLSLAVHVGMIIAFAVLLKALGLLNRPKETIIPIDLTLVLNENLDGKENEPPPVLKPKEVPPPPPKPKAREQVKKLEPPKPLERIETNIVKKVEEKKKDKPDKKDKPKKDLPKKDPPKPIDKKKEQEDRLARMRASATKNPIQLEDKTAKQSGNGKTEKALPLAERIKLLNQGYKPGSSNQLAPNEISRCVSLISMAINRQWDRMQPQIGRPGNVVLTCKLNSNGGLVNVRVSGSCGDKVSDRAALIVAQSVQSIPGLSDEFKFKHMKESLSIAYKVEGK